MNKAVYESTPAVKYRRKIMEHEKMKEEKAKGAKQRASYGEKIERERGKKPSAACVTCGLYKHTKQNNRLCLGNASHRLHKIFNKDPLEAIVLHAEEYVQSRQGKKQKRGSDKLVVHEEMYIRICAMYELVVRAASCLTTVGSS